MSTVPILVSIVGLFAARCERDWATWTVIGVLWGLVIAGAWSIGLYFAPAALLLSASGLARADARRTWWNALLIPLWMIEGVSTTAMLFLTVAVAREIFGDVRLVLPGQTREFPTMTGSISFVPEAVTFGAWLFASTSCFLTACRVARSLWTGRANRLRPLTIGLIAVLLLTVILGATAWRRAIAELQRGGGGGCSSVNGRTTCTAA